MSVVNAAKSYGTLVVVDPADYREVELRHWWHDADLASYLCKCVGQPVSEANFVFVTLAAPDTALFALIDNELTIPEPRPYSEVEMRRLFLTHLSHLCHYWDAVKTHTTLEKLRGLTHSVLALLDGSSAAMPGWDLIPHPHEDDFEYRSSLGENYFPDNVNICDGNLAFKFYNNEITTEEIVAFLDTKPIDCAVRIETEGEVMPGSRIGKFTAKVANIDQLPVRIADEKPNVHIVGAVVRHYIEDLQRNAYPAIDLVEFKEDHALVIGDLISKPILELGYGRF